MRAIDDVVKRCVENVNFFTTNGMPAEDAAVMITTPKGWKAPPRFPRGEIVQVKGDGTRVRCLPAMKLLAWFTAHGFANIKIETLK